MKGKEKNKNQALLDCLILASLLPGGNWKFDIGGCGGFDGIPGAAPLNPAAPTGGCGPFPNIGAGGCEPPNTC